MPDKKEKNIFLKKKILHADGTCRENAHPIDVSPSRPQRYNDHLELSL